ncbi:alkyl hydroperoxide reductase [Halomicronema hongdechloris C2206]|uniref:Alkyl hydroperoxide reductase n=1 Tax=Halomicronema hongdechloris C2206 TaxID=1641165 RepID=A0A1Z3HIA5_9CYAN|nr:redoxin domain-containing protein [Halomicronema hongdechloris]ASC70018.1 alkyl hydroperoxide reductase [Halomicronema hongdechloris C2206]
MLTSSDLSGLFTPRFFRNFLPIPATDALAIGQRPPDICLPNITQGDTITLSEFWGKQPVVLAFTRIFTEKQYCPFCYPHIVALGDAYDRFRQQGVEVLMITSTDAAQSKTIVQDLGLPLPLLSDPSCQSFQAYQTGQALGAPLPAQFVLDAQGRLRYRHLFSFLNHNASVDTLLEVIGDLGD